MFVGLGEVKRMVQGSMEMCSPETVLALQEHHQLNPGASQKEKCFNNALSGLLISGL